MRAYHFGPRFLVELEVVMDEHTPLRESHDVGLLLQVSAPCAYICLHELAERVWCNAAAQDRGVACC